MAHADDRPDREGKVTGDTTEDLITRGAAHGHDHHGGPPEITPEIEAAVRAAAAAR